MSSNPDKVIISDTTCLIGLSNIGQLNILQEMYGSIVITPEVAADLSEDTLIIESKYLRGNITPSVATEGIAADITKVPDGFSLLFVVFDPERKITDDIEFIYSFEQKRELCFVRVYR